MPLKYVTGDLFAGVTDSGSDAAIITHVCNDKGGWGSGFVVPLGKNYPLARRKYLENCPSELALGHTQIVQVRHGNDDDQYVFPKYQGEKAQLWLEEGKQVALTYVANMVAQHGTISPANLKPIKYRALANCMHEVAWFIKHSDEEVKIHAPLFGSALAGGNWDFIEELIQEIWSPFDVTIYQLPGQELRPITHLKRVKDAFDAVGINYVVEEEDGYFNLYTCTPQEAEAGRQARNSPH